jgi:hypothetical protein
MSNLILPRTFPRFPMRTLHPFAIEPSSLLNDMAQQHHPDFALSSSSSTAPSTTPNTSLNPSSRSPTPIQVRSTPPFVHPCVSYPPLPSQMPSSTKQPAQHSISPLSPMHTDSNISLQPPLGASKKPDSVLNGQLPPWSASSHESHDHPSGHLNPPQVSRLSSSH